MYDGHSCPLNKFADRNVRTTVETDLSLNQRNTKTKQRYLN
jgi:hypothetical protein